MELVYLPQKWVSPPTPIPCVVCPAQVPFLGALEQLDGTSCKHRDTQNLCRTPEPWSQKDLDRERPQRGGGRRGQILVCIPAP